MSLRRIKLLPLSVLMLTSPQMLYSQTQSSQANSSAQQKYFFEQRNAEIPEIKTEESSNKVWNKFLELLNNARLKKKINAPTTAITQGLDVGAGYTFESSPSIGGQYSGIDVWQINAAAFPELFGAEPSFNASVSAGREITYIQQFKSRKESLLRVPYDPITKLPVESKIFFEKTKNYATGATEDVFKVGDFVGFRAPLTLALGKEFLNSDLAAKLKLDLNLNYVINGEFDVHVFRMSDQLVRVKVIAIQENSKNISFGYNLFGVDTLSKKIVKHFVRLDLVRLFAQKKKSGLFIADYVFNLSSASSRGLYDQLIGHKMKVFDPDSALDHFRYGNPFRNNGDKKDKILADLEKINVIAREDDKLPLNKKRVVKIIAAYNNTKSSTIGGEINLLRLVRLNSNSVKSQSEIAIMPKDDLNSVQRYTLDTYSKNMSSKWFWLWGETNTKSLSTLVKTDENLIPVHLMGFNMNRKREDLSMNKKEFDRLREDLQSILPKPVQDKLVFPKWDFSKGNINNVYIEQELFFTNQIFNVNLKLKNSRIRQSIADIVQTLGDKIDSAPHGLEGQINHPDTSDVRAIAYQQKDYKEAFSWEIAVISQELEYIFNPQVSAVDKYKAFQKLNDNYPLFTEIGSMILLQLIPEEHLASTILARLSISGRNVVSAISEFPSREEFNKSLLFREILAQNDYVMDRSYNLRNFIKEDGSLYQLHEIVTNK